MPGLSIRDASLADAYELLSRPIRPEDKAEWIAGQGIPPSMALPEAFRDDRTKLSKALLWEGRVVAIYGLTVEGNGAGFLWLVGADEKLPLTVGFMAVWKDGIAELHAKAAKLIAVADNRNPRHHVWLKAMGFKATETDWRGGFDPSVGFTLYVRDRD